MCDSRSSAAVRTSPLFRPEANGSRRGPSLCGDIVLLRPVSLAILLWLLLAVFALAATFLTFGHYTSKTHVTGILLPDHGILKIFPGQSGTLVECHARNGQRVHKGDVLFLLASDRNTSAGESLAAEIRRQSLVRRQSLLSERGLAGNLSAQQETDLRDRLDKLAQQSEALSSEIKTAETQLKLDEEILDRYRQLESAKLISVLALREKENASLDQQKMLAELHRSQISLEQSGKELHFELKRLPLQLALQNSSVDRAISELDAQLSEQEANHLAVVRAPADGTLSAVLDHRGIGVGEATTLASLIPEGALLEAHLYAPSSSLGFIKIGKTALLRYSAYPSQQFGRQIACLSEISQVALSPVEYTTRTGVTTQEPMYEMIAKIPSQTLTIFGQSRELWPGMQLDADILLERRALLDWFFEPILAAKGGRSQ
jgi:membrane fusion protein